jgi:RNA polymerase sigma-70 factor (ECF subfamily)
MLAEERALIEKFQAGEKEAFDGLMGLFQEKALTLAYLWTGHREDSLDIVQEAFVRLFKMLPSWRPEASLFTWLYRVIINLAIDRGRRSSQHPTASLEEAEAVPETRRDAHPGIKLENRETGELIARAVSTLPPRQKEVFILRHYQHLPLKEIARIQKSSLGGAKANLFQATQKLQKSLRGYYQSD